VIQREGGLKRGAESLKSNRIKRREERGWVRLGLVLTYKLIPIKYSNPSVY
jgi:hypothetical protein